MHKCNSMVKALRIPAIARQQILLTLLAAALGSQVIESAASVDVTPASATASTRRLIP